VRIAIIAPLVTPIAEPQLGGSQAIVSDVAQGLARRGHVVDVYASTDSWIDGVHVVDTGIDSEALAETLYHAGEDQDPDDEAARDAFETVYALVTAGRPDIVHNHAFDAPAIDLAASIGVPVVHSLHLPPDPAIAALCSARTEPWRAYRTGSWRRGRLTSVSMSSCGTASPSPV
jgi:hypothetical protein